MIQCLNVSAGNKLCIALCTENVISLLRVAGSLLTSYLIYNLLTTNFTACMVLLLPEFQFKAVACIILNINILQLKIFLRQLSCTVPECLRTTCMQCKGETADIHLILNTVTFTTKRSSTKASDRSSYQKYQISSIWYQI